MKIKHKSVQWPLLSSNPPPPHPQVPAKKKAFHQFWSDQISERIQANELITWWEFNIHFFYTLLILIFCVNHLVASFGLYKEKEFRNLINPKKKKSNIVYDSVCCWWLKYLYFFYLANRPGNSKIEQQKNKSSEYDDPSQIFFFIALMARMRAFNNIFFSLSASTWPVSKWKA